jgi:hypothetical protein
VEADAFGHPGKARLFDPVTSGALCVDLKPDLQILFGTMPVRFMNGTWTAITLA